MDIRKVSSANCFGVENDQVGDSGERRSRQSVELHGHHPSAASEQELVQ